MTLKGQTRDHKFNTFRAQYLENSWILRLVPIKGPQ